MAIVSLRESSRISAIRNLAADVDAVKFQQEFGDSVSHLDKLVEAKTVTITKLMDLMPAGTANPSATLYNTTMYLMAALLAIALVANLFIHPVEASHYMNEEPEGPDESV